MKRNWGRLIVRILMFIFMVSGVTAGLVYSIVGTRMLYQWIQTSPVFAIEDIQVSGHQLADPAEIILLSGVQKGENILAADLLEGRERLSLDRRFERVFLSRRWPDKVMIHVRERQPIAFVRLDRLYGVDSDAELIPLPAVHLLPDLPVITGVTVDRNEAASSLESSNRFETIRETMSTDPNLGRGIYIINMIKHFSPDFLDRISEIHVDHPHDPVVYTVDDGLTIRIGVGRYPHKINLLNKTLEQLDRDGIKTRIIDLRFKDQVIIRPIVSGDLDHNQS